MQHEMLRERDEWLASHHDEIAEQIEHGYAQAERGELMDGDEAFALLRERRLARQSRD